jgi:hypothetical protein
VEDTTYDLLLGTAATFRTKGDAIETRRWLETCRPSSRVVNDPAPPRAVQIQYYTGSSYTAKPG